MTLMAGGDPDARGDEEAPADTGRVVGALAVRAIDQDLRAGPQLADRGAEVPERLHGERGPVRPPGARAQREGVVVQAVQAVRRAQAGELPGLERHAAVAV